MVGRVKQETALAAVGHLTDNSVLTFLKAILAKVISYLLASLAIPFTISPVSTVWSGAGPFKRLDEFLPCLHLFPTHWHLSLLVPSPLVTNFLVKLPVFHQALLGTVLGGQTSGAAVGVSAVLETIVTMLCIFNKF